MSTARAKDLAMVAFGLLVILVDQLTKHWVQTYFAAHPGTVVSVVGDLLTLEYTQNPGVAFSLLTDQGIKFLLIALAIGVIVVLYWRTRETGTLLLKVSFGLVLGGAIGNLPRRMADPGHHRRKREELSDSSEILAIEVRDIVPVELLDFRHCVAHGLTSPPTRILTRVRDVPWERCRRSARC